MSDTQSQSYQSTQSSKKRVSPVLVWMLVLIAAGGAFAAAVVYAGGWSGVNGMLSNLIASIQTPATPPAKNPVASATVSAVGTLPPDAQARMYVEQVESQGSIARLAGGEVVSFDLGTPVTAGDSADVPLTVRFTDGSHISGVAALRKYDGTWYFFSLRAAGKPDRALETTPAIDPAVVSAITVGQALPTQQELITDGVLSGGFKKATVTGVVPGAGTKTVNVSLSGGREATQTGRFVLIQKTDGPDTYWFIARFEKTQ